MTDFILKKKINIVYNSVISLLSISIVIMLVAQSSSNLSPKELQLMSYWDKIIWIVFTLDYLGRLIASENKKFFFKNNLIDLIAIIPFGALLQSFRVFDALKFLKFARVLEIARSFVFLIKFWKHFQLFIKINNFKYILELTIVTIILGALGLHFTENKTFADSIWLSFVTATTVGYGDISPTTTLGRIIAAVLMLTGIGFIGMLTGTISTYFLKRKVSNSFKSEILENIKEKLDHFEHLTEEDVSDICSTLKALKASSKK